MECISLSDSQSQDSHSPGPHSDYEHRTLTIAALQHSAWRLLSKSFLCLSKHQEGQSRKKEAAISAISHWREYRLRQCFRAVREKYRRLAGWKPAALRLYKLHSLRRGLTRLAEYRRPEEDIETKVRAILLWKRFHSQRAIRALLWNCEVESLQWEADYSALLLYKSLLIRRGIAALRHSAEIKTWGRELNRRATEFQVLICPIHAMSRVFLRLRELKSAKVDRGNKNALAQSAYRRCLFEKTRQAIWTLAASERREHRSALLRKALQTMRLNLLFAAKTRLATRFFMEKMQKMAGIIITTWKHFCNKSRKVKDCCRELRENLAWKSQHKHFTRWMAAFKERENAEMLRTQRITALQRRVVYRPFHCWKEFLARQQRKSFVGYFYNCNLQRRLISYLQRHQEKVRRIEAIYEEVVSVHIWHSSARYWRMWQAALDLLRFQRKQERVADNHYLRHLALAALVSFAAAVQRDTFRIRSLVPRRRFLLKQCALSLWRRAANRQIEVKATARRCRIRHKAAVLNHYMKSWKSQSASKAAAHLLAARKVAAAQEQLRHFALRPCLEAWVEYHNSVAIKRMKYSRSAKLYRINKLKAVVLEWVAATHIGKIKGRKRRMALRCCESSRKRAVIALLAEHRTTQSIRRRIHSVAIAFNEQCIKSTYFRALMTHRNSQKRKHMKERMALRLREADIMKDALRSIAKVGFTWRSQRLALTLASAERKKNRVWEVVAKCAERWKEKALAGRKTKTAKVTTSAEECVNGAGRVTQRKIPEWVNEEKNTSSKRPPPRRPHTSLPPKQTPVPSQPLVLPQPQATPAVRPAPITQPAPTAQPPVLAQPVSIPARLSEIQAELLEYRIEKEALQKLENSASSEADYRKLSILRSKYERNVPRIQALSRELASLKGLPLH